MPGDFDTLFDGDYAQTGAGVLEVLPGGWGFLRRNIPGLGDRDIYVAQDQIQGFSLKAGDTITGQIRPSKETEKYPVLSRLESINGAAIRH